MYEFIIDFDDKPKVRDWNDEHRRVLIDTATHNTYVYNRTTGKPFMLRWATKVMIADEDVALMFYLTFKDTLIYEPAELPASRFG